MVSTFLHTGPGIQYEALTSQPARLRSAPNSESAQASMQTRPPTLDHVARDSEPLLPPASFLFDSPAHETDIPVPETQASDATFDGRLHGGTTKVSYIWMLAVIPFLTIALWATIVSRIDVCTALVCDILQPEDLDRAGLRGTPQHTPYDPTASSHVSVLFLRHLNTESSRGSCATDPVVQARVSKLLAVLSAISGILSCVTSGWWGSFSDRYGRNSLIAVSTFGTVLNNLNIVFVSSFASRLPGNYWFLTVGSVMEGVLGGFTAASVGMGAFLVDCTDPSSRSRVLTLAAGFVAIGSALGPTLGNLLIRISEQVLAVFYGAVALQVTVVILIWTLLPESLSHQQMLANRRAYAVQRGRHIWTRVFALLVPLNIFLPIRSKYTSGKRVRSSRNWNLTLIAIAYSTNTLFFAGLLDVSFQYTHYTFGWTGETVGYWLSLLNITKAVFLSLLLPVIIKWFKAAHTSCTLPPESSPLIPSSHGGNLNAPLPSEVQFRPGHSFTVDLSVAQLSALLYAIFHLAMGLVSIPWVFVACSLAGVVGAGFIPAINSVAAEVYMQREHQMRGEGEHQALEVGKLYGALGLLDALGGQIIGPPVMLLIFMATVSSVPGTVFLVSAGVEALSVFVLGFIQLPRHGSNVVASCSYHTVVQGVEQG